MGADAGYEHFFKNLPLEKNLSLIKTSLVARWYPSTLISKLNKKEPLSSNFYLEGGIGHGFNDDILDNSLLNYNHLKIGIEMSRLDFGVNLAGYSINKQVSNGLMSTYGFYLGYTF